MLRIAFGSAVCLHLACSSPTTTTSTGPTGGTSLDPSKLVVDLSSAEQAAYCDWGAQQYGGYGHMVVCDAGPKAGNSADIAADQGMCVMGLQQFASSRPACTLTVGDGMACVQWGIQNPCAGMATGPAGCQVLLSAACAH